VKTLFNWKKAGEAKRLLLTVQQVRYSITASRSTVITLNGRQKHHNVARFQK